ncbi:hypothetical protein L6164_002232 [Bauhinia variegata]|uniref:Uncharacterized protein n=1 Tax=Bauhinia variegata TaxID=167791 RepID=A0ACB9PZE1_BAUVA|nr:hypothetical protein L6164_002232 [Bauhinia variegata]
MVEGLPLIAQPNQLCDGCLLGKQVRKPFPKESSSRATKSLQLVHADICGPIKPSSHGKSNYFLLFIDDFSHKTWVYFLTRKDEAFGVFQKFKAQVENESGFTIKALRNDRGGEFTSMEFNKFCETNGIRCFLTVPYSPQQNGVVECKNRSILNMTRSMLKSKNMPKEFWAKAIACAVYLSNLSPSRNNSSFRDVICEASREVDMPLDVFAPALRSALSINISPTSLWHNSRTSRGVRPL